MTDNTNTPNKGIKEIWGSILPTLIDKIQKAENDSYSINLLEEVKMANKDVRKKNNGNGEKSSLDVNVNENANSRILAKLFQYKSPDGEYEILQSLLDYISNRDENAVKNFGNIEIDNDNTIITTEETLRQDTGNIKNDNSKTNNTTENTPKQENGRIDILVRTGNYAIIFENKLFNAPDQKHQLAGYIEKVKGVKQNGESKYKDNNIFVIYLSRKGDEPAENSWKTSKNNSYKSLFEDRYANISFREDIRCWLKGCVLPYVRKKDTDLESALVQYINYLDRMFMKNNDNLTKWLEKKLEKGEGESSEPDHIVKMLCLEKVEGLIDVLHEEGTKKKRKITVQKLSEFINKDINKEDLQKINALLGKTDTQEGIGTQEGTDLLNKVIAVIENLRDDCGDELLKTFNKVSKKNSEDNSEGNSKGYFDTIHVTSRKRDAYCTLKNKKWKGEIRFIWNPFFFNAENKYKLTLEILDGKEKFNDLDNKEKLKGELLNGINDYFDIKTEDKKFGKWVKISDNFKTSGKTQPLLLLVLDTNKPLELDENCKAELEKGSKNINLDWAKISYDFPTFKKTYPLLRLILETNKKLLYFAPDDQETLFKAIYGSLSGVIEAIDNCF